MALERISLCEGDSSDPINLFRLGLSLTDSTGQGTEDVWDIDPDTAEIQVSEYLEHLTDDFCLGLESKVLSEGERLIQTRMEIILFVVLAKVKMSIHPNGTGVPWGFDMSANDVPCWVSPYDLTVEQIYGKGDYGRKGHRNWQTQVDYVLRYGGQVDLHTNLVVLKRRTGEPDGGWGALAVLAAIHHKRKKAGIRGDIYGICTNSYQWIFFHVDKNGLYSRLFLEWTEDQKEIIRHLCRIIRQATNLAREVGGFDDVKLVAETQSDEMDDRL